MLTNMEFSALYTDLYELTMAQAYYFSNKKDDIACFDYYFRSNPFKGGYTVFAGLSDFLELLKDFKFHRFDKKLLFSTILLILFTFYLFVEKNLKI